MVPNTTVSNYTGHVNRTAPGEQPPEHKRNLGDCSQERELINILNNSSKHDCIQKIRNAQEKNRLRNIGLARDDTIQLTEEQINQLVYALQFVRLSRLSIGRTVTLQQFMDMLGQLRIVELDLTEILIEPITGGSWFLQDAHLQSLARCLDSIHDNSILQRVLVNWATLTANQRELLDKFTQIPTKVNGRDTFLLVYVNGPNSTKHSDWGDCHAALLRMLSQGSVDAITNMMKKATYPLMYIDLKHKDCGALELVTLRNLLLQLPESQIKTIRFGRVDDTLKEWMPTLQTVVHRVNIVDLTSFQIQYIGNPGSFDHCHPLINNEISRLHGSLARSLRNNSVTLLLHSGDLDKDGIDVLNRMKGDLSCVWDAQPENARKVPFAERQSIEKKWHTLIETGNTQEIENLIDRPDFQSSILDLSSRKLSSTAMKCVEWIVSHPGAPFKWVGIGSVEQSNFQGYSLLRALINSSHLIRLDLVHIRFYRTIKNSDGILGHWAGPSIQNAEDLDFIAHLIAQRPAQHPQLTIVLCNDSLNKKSLEKLKNAHPEKGVQIEIIGEPTQQPSDLADTDIPQLPENLDSGGHRGTAHWSDKDAELIRHRLYHWILRGNLLEVKNLLLNPQWPNFSPAQLSYLNYQISDFFSWGGDVKACAQWVHHFSQPGGINASINSSPNSDLNTEKGQLPAPSLSAPAFHASPAENSTDTADISTQIALLTNQLNHWVLRGDSPMVEKSLKSARAILHTQEQIAIMQNKFARFQGLPNSIGEAARMVMNFKSV